MIVTQYVYYPQLRRSHAITVEVLDGETVEQAIIERGDTISEWILDGTYASTHAKIVSAQEHGEHVIIDMDPGMFRMTAEQALEAFENIAPGEGFVWIDAASPEATRAHDLTQYESFPENQHRLTAEEAAQGDINDENTRAFFAERGIDTEEN